MEAMKAVLLTIIIAGVVGLFFLGTFLFRWYMGPEMVRLEETYQYRVQVVRDETNYETIRMVEDTARAMISSWNSDRIRWLNYKDSDNERHQEWASAARMRANTTASTFNNFMLENNYVWAINIPEDLQERLPDCLSETVD